MPRLGLPQLMIFVVVLVRAVTLQLEEGMQANHADERVREHGLFYYRR